MKPHSRLLEVSGEGGTCQRAAHTHTHDQRSHMKHTLAVGNYIFSIRATCVYVLALLYSPLTLLIIFTFYRLCHLQLGMLRNESFPDDQ